MGLRLWANDNDSSFPWEISIADGGSKDAETMATWADHFRAASNELVTTKVLTCPKDKDKTVMDEWPNPRGVGQYQLFRRPVGEGIQSAKLAHRRS